MNHFRNLFIVVVLIAVPSFAGECPLYSGEYKSQHSGFADATLKAVPHKDGCDVWLKIGTCAFKFITAEQSFWDIKGCEPFRANITINSKKEFIGHYTDFGKTWDVKYAISWPLAVAPKFYYEDGSTFHLTMRKDSDEFPLRQMLQQTFDYDTRQVSFRVRGGPYPNFKVVDNEKIVFFGGEYSRVPGKYIFEIEACQNVHEDKCSTVKYTFNVWQLNNTPSP